MKRIVSDSYCGWSYTSWYERGSWGHVVHGASGGGSGFATIRNSGRLGDCGGRGGPDYGREGGRREEDAKRNHKRRKDAVGGGRAAADGGAGGALLAGEDWLDGG